MQVGYILIGSDLRIMPKVIRMCSCYPSHPFGIWHALCIAIRSFAAPVSLSRSEPSLTSGIKFMSKVFPLEPETMVGQCVGMVKVNSALAEAKNFICISMQEHGRTTDTP